jgi:hypothetical protein
MHPHHIRDDIIDAMKQVNEERSVTGLSQTIQSTWRMPAEAVQADRNAERLATNTQDRD